jgi:ribosomal protein L28
VKLNMLCGGYHFGLLNIHKKKLILNAKDNPMTIEICTSGSIKFYISAASEDKILKKNMTNERQ